MMKVDGVISFKIKILRVNWEQPFAFTGLEANMEQRFFKNQHSTITIIHKYLKG